MTFCCGCFAPQNSEKQPGNEVISLFFRSPNHRRTRISAEDELSMAVNSLQKQPAPPRVRMFAAPAFMVL
jgi:hypothetical protein